jgi:hypothetical protein
MVALNVTLDWALFGTGKEHSISAIKINARGFGKAQGKRAAALGAMTANRSAGHISEVALAIIQEEGLCPHQVLHDALAAQRLDPRGRLEFEHSDRRDALYFVDGVLEATSTFEGGHYYMGTLTLWGDFPETYAAAAKGRKLDGFASHPALRSTKVTVARASVRHQALDLKHKVTTIAVEELERRPSGGGTAEATAALAA